jgi:protein O-mannosyl-transferase
MPGEQISVFERRRTFYVGSFLAIATLLLYWPASHYKFIVVDDYQYVSQNPPVLKGFSWSGMHWALWSMYADNWHPLTWISHMLDCSLYGLYPGGHHLTNVFFHTANTVLLFLLLRRLTRKLWPGAFVAALFAWHPLHVESVAWICERKDVLSTFFLLLTVGAYSQYVASPTRARLFLALALFLLGLMSKPMLVTLPCVLLLLDYWPLHRISTGAGQATLNKQWLKLIAEKIPFFFLSLLGCALTMMAQSANGAVKSAADIPLLVRLANPVCSYARYLAKAVWPEHLVIFYPMPTAPQWPLFAVSLLFLIACTCLAFKWRAKFPWFLVGWLWFLGTLVPVIGIVQVGYQAMADRYTYIPYIGLFIMLAWGAEYWIKKQQSLQPLAVFFGVALLAACVAVTRLQLGYWRSSVEVFSHAVSLTRANKFSNGNLNYALAEAARGDHAIPRYQAILHLKPSKLEDGRPLIYDTASIGRRDDEVTQLRELLNYDPNNATLYNNLGIVLFEQNKPEEAMAQFQKAIEWKPKSPWAYFNEAIVLQKKGRAREAIADYTRAIGLRPVWPEALDKLAYLLATCPKSEGRNAAKAVELATRANELTDRSSPGYLHTLAIAYAATGSFTNAAQTAELARQKAQAGGFQVMAANLQNEVALCEAEKAPASDWQKPPLQLIVSQKNEVLPLSQNQKR